MSFGRAGCLLLLNVALLKLTWLSLTLFSLSASAQEFYRWTDANGQLHVSQTPPPANVKYEVTTLQQLSRHQLQKTSPVPADNNRKIDGTNKTGATNNLAEQTQQLDQQVDALNQRASELQQQLDKQRCDNARRNKTSLSRQAPVFQTDANGQQVFLDDEQRAVQLELADEEISRYCEKP